MENAMGFPRSILQECSQSYVKHDLRKYKIIATSTTGFYALAPNLRH
jgi:hypothetical protein